MDNTREKIDFVVDNEFFDSLSESWDSGDSDIMKCERFLLFYPLYHLYLLYGIMVRDIEGADLRGKIVYCVLKWS